MKYNIVILRTSLALTLALCGFFCLFAHADEPVSSDSSDFNGSPMILAKNHGEFAVVINGETELFPAHYAVAADFENKGGNAILWYPTTVFEPRKSNVKCSITGTFDPNMQSEIERLEERLNSDPLLRVLHKVDYDERKDVVRAVIRIQFYPDELKDCILDAVNKSKSTQGLIGGREYDVRELEFDSEFYSPQLEFRLTNGVRDDPDEGSDLQQSDLLAYSSFDQSQNYLGTQLVTITFCRKDAVNGVVRSSFESFRLFCDESEYVKARLSYLYKAKECKGGTSKTTIKFKNSEEVVKKLETLSKAQGGTLPIVDRRTRNNFITTLEGTIQQDVIDDTNNDPYLRQYALNLMIAQSEQSNGIFSNAFMKEFRYDDSDYDEVVQKYLEPIIRTKITNAIDSNQRLTDQQKASLKERFKDVNVKTETGAMAKVNIGIFGVGANGSETVDASTRDLLMNSVAEGLREATSSDVQVVNNEIIMDCKDFTLYTVDTGRLGLKIQLAQNIISTRSGVEHDVSIFVPLGLTSDVLQKCGYRDFKYYKEQYDALKLKYDALITTIKTK